MTPTPLRVGISTCPNDTFAFHALLTGEVSDPELDLSFELLDVEELNRGLAAGRYDVAKGSFPAALHPTRAPIRPPPSLVDENLPAHICFTAWAFLTDHHHPLVDQAAEVVTSLAVVGLLVAAGAAALHPQAV